MIVNYIIKKINNVCFKYRQLKIGKKEGVAWISTIYITYNSVISSSYNQRQINMRTYSL